MKKLLALLLVAVMIVSCCGATLTAKKEEPEPTESPTEFQFPEIDNEKPAEEYSDEESVTVIAISMGMLTFAKHWENVDFDWLTRVLDDGTFRIDLAIPGVGLMASETRFNQPGADPETWQSTLQFLQELSASVYDSVMVPNGLEDQSILVILNNDIVASPTKTLAEVVDGEIVYDFVNQIDLRENTDADMAKAEEAAALISQFLTLAETDDVSWSVEVSSDSLVVIRFVRPDQGSLAISAMLGAEEAVEMWDQVLASACTISETFSAETLPVAGLDGISVGVDIMDDLIEDKVLASIVDGDVVYDIASDTE